MVIFQIKDRKEKLVATIDEMGEDFVVKSSDDNICGFVENEANCYLFKDDSDSLLGQLNYDNKKSMFTVVKDEVVIGFIDHASPLGGKIMDSKKHSLGHIQIEGFFAQLLDHKKEVISFVECELCAPTKEIVVNVAAWFFFFSSSDMLHIYTPFTPPRTPENKNGSPESSNKLSESKINSLEVPNDTPETRERVLTSADLEDYTYDLYDPDVEVEEP